MTAPYTQLIAASARHVRGDQTTRVHLQRHNVNSYSLYSVKERPTLEWPRFEHA